MKLELRATPEEVMRAVAALQAFGKTREIPESILFELALALEECGSNVVNHALQRDARQQFQVMIEQAGDAVSIELRDRGPAFDPTRAPAAAAAAGIDRPPGGWGIQLVRRYMDEIHYFRDGGENVLRLTKRLPTTAAN